MREIQDHFFREAKRKGYRSRAAFKLIEIDDRKHLLSKGDLVLDCGAAPGSWLEVASPRVGHRGRVLGVDLKPIDERGLPQNVQVIEGDVLACDVPGKLGDLADVVLSDMAPSTTGTPSADHFHSARLCDDLFDRLPDWLQRGGHCVMKVYEGEAYPDLLKRSGRMFEKSKGFKPKASRSSSVEIFMICQGFRGPDPDGIQPDDPRQAPRQKPTGW
jgi:23S rRNA (uridine2552-2'-O)-methyltransferase